MPLDRIVELGQVDVLHQLAVDRRLEVIALQFDADRVPFGRLVDLLGRGDGAVDAAGQFALLGELVVPEVGDSTRKGDSRPWYGW